MNAARCAALFSCLVGCASVAQSAADRATGVTTTQRANADWNAFERRPVGVNPNAPSFECVPGLVSTAGPLGGPVTGARVEVCEDDVSTYVTTTQSDGAFRVCAKPETTRVRVEATRGPRAARPLAFTRDTRPARVDLTLP